MKFTYTAFILKMDRFDELKVGHHYKSYKYSVISPVVPSQYGNKLGDGDENCTVKKIRQTLTLL